MAPTETWIANIEKLNKKIGILTLDTKSAESGTLPQNAKF